MPKQAIPDQPEITPEMIAAGEDALFDGLRLRDLGPDAPDQAERESISRAVFLRMWEKRRQ
jgi:hypothetical protein